MSNLHCRTLIEGFGLLLDPKIRF